MLLGLNLLLSPGCYEGSSHNTGSPGRFAVGRLTFETWWDSVSELEALSALLTALVYYNPALEPSCVRNEPNETCEVRPLTPGDEAAEFEPDIKHHNGGRDLLEACKQGDFTLVYLQTSFDQTLAPHVRKTVVADWDSIPEPGVKRRTLACGVPIGVHQVNRLYINRASLARKGILPEQAASWTTLAQWQAALSEHSLKVAVPGEGWVLNLLMFENIMLSLVGEEKYQQFWRGEAVKKGASAEEVADGFTQAQTAGASPDTWEPDLTVLEQAVEVMLSLRAARVMLDPCTVPLAELITNDITSVTAQSLACSSATPGAHVPIANDDLAWVMFAAGYADFFVSGDWRDQDARAFPAVEMTAFPGTAAFKVFTIDVLVQNARAPNHAAAGAIMQSLQDYENVQAPFVEAKGAQAVTQAAVEAANSALGEDLKFVPSLPAFTSGALSLEELEVLMAEALVSGSAAGVIDYVRLHYCPSETGCPKPSPGVTK